MKAWSVLLTGTGSPAHETDDVAEAIRMAKASRADGYYDAKLGKWCGACERYRPNFSARCCKTCAASVLTNARGAIPFGGTATDPDSIWTGGSNR